MFLFLRENENIYFMINPYWHNAGSEIWVSRQSDLKPLSLPIRVRGTALMIALYLVMDSFGTAANVTSDGAIAIILDKIYKKEEHIEADNTQS